jgi:thymidine kinase
MNSQGYLELIIGPMYAGKSTELLRIINRFKCLKKNIIVINHSLNNRYGSNGLTTHNNEKMEKCIILNELKELDINLIKSTDVIIIEELQFFNDAFDLVTSWVDNFHKIVIAAGLDGDFNREPFGDVLKLIPHCDKITKLNSLCTKCSNGTIALFTKRITNDIDKTLIGSNGIYEAVCRKHFLE